MTHINVKEDGAPPLFYVYYIDNQGAAKLKKERNWENPPNQQKKNGFFVQRNPSLTKSFHVY